MGDRLGILRDVVQSLFDVAEDGAPRGNSARAVKAQATGLALAGQIRRIASAIEKDHEAAVAYGVASGEQVEPDTGVILTVSRAGTYSAWQQEDLRTAVRPLLLWNDDEGIERTGEEVLELLWHAENGLHPLSGGSMRMAVFRDRFGLDPKEFATYRKDKPKVRFMAGKKLLEEPPQ